MTRVFLAAGVSALAIAAPASAGPHGGPGRPQVMQMRGGGGGGQRSAAVQRGGGGRAFAAPRMQAFGPPRMQRFAAPRPQRFAAPRMQRFAAPRMQRQRFAAAARPQRQRFAAASRAHTQRLQMRSARQQFRAQRMQAQTRMAQRQQLRANRLHAQTRMAQRQQIRANRAQAQTRFAQRQQIRANRAQAQTRFAQRQQIRANRAQAQTRFAQRQQMQLQANRVGPAQNRIAARQQAQGARNLMAQRQQLGAAGAGVAAANLLAQRRALVPSRVANADAFRASQLAGMAATPSTTFVAPAQAVRFVGQPVSTVTNYVPLSVLPASVSYLYPDTPAYYYEYGDGYLYQVDRSTSLIDALIPLLAGGFLPGTYLPTPYMSSYVPAYYGLNSFYPAYYGGTCNRYAYGVVYQVDCATGMVEDVVPLYAGGYGVGQMLPSAYDYYNVPMQYRSLYYPTANYSYWYAPGAIYQYDPRSSLITSVAALMSPGFAIGQPLPAGYEVYNVPYAYRSTYYDSPTAWYRYNNGYIYQVDPTTMLVTATVASLLS